MRLPGRPLTAAFLLFLTAGFLAAEPVGRILERARSQLGTPYRSGGIAPGGFDCSGFVSWLYRPTVPGLPRISKDQAGTGTPVQAGDWQPGDLLFYATGSDSSRINHVAVWIGNGQIIHSISGGPETGVVVTPADSRYWSRRYVTSRRVLTDAERPPEEPAVPIPEADGPEAPAERSPWDSFDGILEGDFHLWLEKENEAFEAYKKQNG